jgi:carbonic anhydrase/acetyltransferase-like protein (isoleucine patch superfamily)
MTTPSFPMMYQTGQVYVASNAVVYGDVILAPGVNIWFGSIIRGDVGTIQLGPGVNVQDGCILHTDHDESLCIEDEVVIGHAAVVHGRRIGARSLIGMRASVLSRSEIGPECIIAAGALIPEGMIVPPRSVVMGIPGKIIRTVRDEEVVHTRQTCQRYRDLAARYARQEIQALTIKPKGE